MHLWSSLEWQGRLPFSQNSATIIAHAATKDEIQAKNMQKKELAETDSVHISEKLPERIAKLSGGMAVIKILVAHNAGVEGEVVVEKIKDSEWEVGYNAMIDRYKNLLEAGVIDLAKVTKCALLNAASVAGMVFNNIGHCCGEAKTKGISSCTT